MGMWSARLLALLVLLAPSLDADARRGVRVDEGAWTDAIDIPSPDCPGAADGSTLVTWRAHVFSGRDDAAHLFDTYCQTTLPGQFDSNALFDPSEAVLAQMVGENLDDRVTAIRYSFLDGVPFDDATGFQWAFYQFPFGGGIVALYGFDDPPIVLDDRSYILRDHTRYWDGARDGYEGEFFCFQDDRFLGDWDGTLEDVSPCQTIGFRLFRDDFE